MLPKENFQPLVSVVIPCHNAEKFIESTVISAINQTWANKEIIIVNDGSTDNSLQILTAIKTHYPTTNIHIINQPNKGVSAARNAGIKSAKGKYIALLDADDIWMHDNLEKKITELEQADAYAIHSNAILIDENDDPIPDQVLVGKKGNLYLDILKWNGTCVPGPSSFIFKKEIINTIGGFNTSLSTAADKDFFIRVAKNYPIEHLDEYTWMYRFHDGNMHKNIKVMEHDTCLILKHHVKKNTRLNRQEKRYIYWKTYIILAFSFLKYRYFFDGLKYLIKSFFRKLLFNLKRIKLQNT